MILIGMNLEDGPHVEALGVAGLLGATLWPRREDPLLAAWSDEKEP